MIVGHSESGETTLLSTLARTLPTESGTVRLFDFNLTQDSPEEVVIFRHHQNIGFIFQQFHFIPTLTCGENVAIPLLLNGYVHTDALKESV